MTLMMPAGRSGQSLPSKGIGSLGRVWGFLDFPVYQSLTPQVLSQVDTLLRT